MLRSIVVDDERHVRETLVTLIGEYCTGMEVVADAADVSEALAAIADHKPDVVFLDVEMPGGNGFELLGSFPTRDFGVIFVTAYDRYAIRAIKLSALDYLLKPVDPFELRRSVARAEEWLIGTGRRRPDFVREHPAPAQTTDKLAVPTEEGLVFVPVADIVRCKAEGNYTRLILRDGGHLVSSRTLGDYEELLAGDGFFRVHHSHLVNLEHARKYVRGKGGVLLMSDGAQVDVSVRRRDAFLDIVTRR